MALRSAKKKANTSGTFDAIDSTDTLDKEDVAENSLEVEKEPEEDTREVTGKVIKRRKNMQKDTTNLSLRINTKDWPVVQFLKIKRHKSIQGLLIEGINLLIKEELNRNREDAKYLWEIE